MFQFRKILRIHQVAKCHEEVAGLSIGGPRNNYLGQKVTKITFLTAFPTLRQKIICRTRQPKWTIIVDSSGFFQLVIYINSKLRIN
jgi:hypothetical protein